MRRRSAHLFLGLVILGILGPLALTVGLAGCCDNGGGHGDCCQEGLASCGSPAGGFSLCCLNAVSNLPGLPLARFGLARLASVTPSPEPGVRLAEPRGILHVPKTS